MGFDMKEKFLLIDGSGFLWRAFHAIPQRYRKSDGKPTNAISGLITMALKPIIEKNNATHVGVVFDSPAPTFRHLIYDGYKAHRPPAPDELREQAPFLRDATKAYGFECIESAGFEADDVIATLASQAVQRGADVVITSSDKDLMQLVQPGIVLFDHKYKKLIKEEDVRIKFGVDPSRVVDVQALAGDTADGIPGVPGIGLKRGAELIQQFGDLESLIENIDEVKRVSTQKSLKENIENARLSKMLATLRTDATLPTTLDNLRVFPAPLSDIRDFMNLWELEENCFPRFSKRDF